jgi:16S rRNA (guanine1207-N2)-methyltransferase
MIELPVSEYTKIAQRSGKILGQNITYFSKPGIPNWDKITPATTLLAEAIQPSWQDQVLIFGCRQGSLGASLGKLVVPGNLSILDCDQIALTCCEMTLKANDIRQFHLSPGISLLPHAAATFDIIALEIPKGRKLTQRWLVESFHLLKEGGSLYLAGENQQGIQSIIKDAQALLGNAVIIDYKKGSRVAQAAKITDPVKLPEWAHEPGIAPDTWTQFKVAVKNSSYDIFSLPGIFSYDRLDDGTALLLDTLQIPEQAQILDAGCGYGVIGLFAAVQFNPSQVDCIDSNLLAVAAAQKNIIENKIKNAQAFASDLLAQVLKKQYHFILTNPPFHSGREVNYDITQALLQQAYHALRPEGKIILVANRFIRYDYLLKKVFQNVTSLAESNRYHVLSAIKNV